MLFAWRHPDLETLTRFLERARDGRRDRLSAHLQKCPRCRESLAFLKKLQEVEKRGPGIEPSEDLLARILADRSSGARVILPTEEVAPVSRRKGHLAALATAAALVALALISRLPSASARDVGGELVLDPAHPTRGATIHAVYRPGMMLQGRDRLVLRARYRSPGDPIHYETVPDVPTHTVSRLERKGDSYTATFELPDSVVYAAFAVEDQSADVVDNRYGRSWELLVSRPDGSPLLEALDQRMRDLMGRDEEEGLSTARRMEREYPRDPRALNWVMAFHRWLGLDGVDSVRARDLARLRDFDRRLESQPAVSDADLGWMAWNASFLGSPLSAKWRSRLMREAPNNTFAVQWRLLDIMQGLRQSRDTAAVLDSLDRLLTRAPPDRLEDVATYGYMIAARTHRAELIRTWVDRLLDASPTPIARRYRYGQYAARLLTVPSLREEGMHRLRTALAWLARPLPEERRLGETNSEMRRRLDGERRGVLANLGRALIDQGNQQGGLDTLALAVETGWDPYIFMTAARERLAAGDTAGALDMDALIAVDPRSDSSFLASFEPMAVARQIDASVWRALRDNARRRFVRSMLDESVNRSLPTVHLLNEKGQRSELASLVEGHVAVVILWSRFCLPTTLQLPRVDAIASRLGRQGVRVISIVEEPPSAEFASFLRQHDLSFSVYHDVDGEAVRALNQWRVPSFYVLDERGEVRFDRAWSVGQVLPQVEALRMEEQVQ